MPEGLRFSVSLLARIGALFAAYLLLADTVQEPELLVGAFCAVLSGIAWTIIHRERAPMRMRAGPLLRIPRALPLLVTDTIRVSWALGRSIALRQPLHGRLRLEPYGAISNEAEDRGRRLLTQWGASLGANRYVIGIDDERGELIVHELVPDDSPLDPLGLG